MQDKCSLDTLNNTSVYTILLLLILLLTIMYYYHVIIKNKDIFIQEAILN